MESRKRKPLSDLTNTYNLINTSVLRNLAKPPLSILKSNSRSTNQKFCSESSNKSNSSIGSSNVSATLNSKTVQFRNPPRRISSIASPNAPGCVDLPSNFQENSLQTEDTDNFQEDMPQDIWEKATEESSQPVHGGDVTADKSKVGEVVNRRTENSAGISNQNQMSEEQQARMEANKLKALQKAAARSRSLHTT